MLYVRRFKRRNRKQFWKFRGNFGDDMNQELVERISGEKVKYAPKDKVISGDPVYLVIGSILHWADENTIVFGSGFGSEDADIRSKPIKVCSVRGPLTRKRLLELGVDCPEVYGDPALLYPLYYQPNKPVKYDVGLVPHYTQDKNKLVSLLASTSENVCIIDVAEQANKVIDKINQCNLILSCSLHGIIVAHAYGIKALHVELENQPLGSYFKFHDYYLSIGINNYEGPVLVNSSTKISELAAHAHINGTFKEPEIDLEKLLKACPFHNR